MRRRFISIATLKRMVLFQFTVAFSRTCNRVAPAYRNWSPASAESMPPLARTGNPGSALPIADTSRRATGRIALPDTPPYVVRRSTPTFGHATASVDRIPIRPDTVLVAVTPSAPPASHTFRRPCTGWPKKVSHYRKSSFNRITIRHYG